MIQLKYFFFLFTALTLSFPANSAEYYTWIDEEGVPNYGEKIPVGYEGRRVEAATDTGYKPDPTASTENSQNTQGDSGEEGEGGETDITAETKKVEAEIAEVKRSNCEIGKRNLAQLQAYSRLKVKEEDGSVRVIGEDEKQTKIDTARKVMKENCM